ncbi:MAG: hypothetical protein GEU81_11400, partial [Nitriliruptorales bacterium]|nr:hypothetical protein [Nitriliruptorales bacterium]
MTVLLLIPVPAGALSFDLPVMAAVPLCCLPVFFTRMAIRRREGALFFGHYPPTWPSSSSTAPGCHASPTASSTV